MKADSKLSLGTPKRSPREPNLEESENFISGLTNNNNNLSNDQTSQTSMLRDDLPTNDNIGDIIALFTFYVSPDPELQNIEFIPGEHACLLRQTSTITPSINLSNPSNQLDPNHSTESKQNDDNDSDQKDDEKNNNNNNNNNNNVNDHNPLESKVDNVEINIVSDIDRSRQQLSQLFLQCLQSTSKYHRSIIQVGNDWIRSITNRNRNNSNNNRNDGDRLNLNGLDSNEYLRHNDVMGDDDEIEQQNRSLSIYEQCQERCELNISESQSCLIILLIFIIILTIILAIIGVDTMVYFWTLFVFISIVILLILFVYWRYNRKYNSYYNETINKLQLLCNKLNQFENNNYQYCDCYFELITQSKLKNKKNNSRLGSPRSPKNNNNNNGGNGNNNNSKNSSLLRQVVIRVVPRDSPQMGRDPEIADD